MSATAQEIVRCIRRDFGTTQADLQAGFEYCHRIAKSAPYNPFGETGMAEAYADATIVLENMVFKEFLLPHRKHAIRIQNARLWKAVFAYRIAPCPEKRSEVFDALNARRAAREWKPTPAMERAVHGLGYLRDEAPDLYRQELHRIYAKA